jgi:hypothetical protein
MKNAVRQNCHEPPGISSRLQKSIANSGWIPVVAVLLLLHGGCATAPKALPTAKRAFNFDQDTFSYPNGLVWEYHYDSNGKWVSHAREPKPDYSQHCFVVARAAVQFFHNARFDPAQPKAKESDYRKLIRKVASPDIRHPLPDEKRIVIPGYASLREFSAAEEHLLKEECGSAVQSYFQRGHWRMIFPFSRSHQEKMAARLEIDLNAKGPQVVHVVRFPQLSINHAVVVFGAKRTEEGIEFTIYDPNHTSKANDILFDAASRTFNMQANDYFPGGRVDVYEIFYTWDY